MIVCYSIGGDYSSSNNHLCFLSIKIISSLFLPNFLYHFIFMFYISHLETTVLFFLFKFMNPASFKLIAEHSDHSMSLNSSNHSFQANCCLCSLVTFMPVKMIYFYFTLYYYCCVKTCNTSSIAWNHFPLFTEAVFMYDL